MTAKHINEPSETRAEPLAFRQEDAQIALALIDLVRALMPTSRKRRLQFRQTIRRTLRDTDKALAFHRQILEAALKIR